MQDFTSQFDAIWGKPTPTQNNPQATSRADEIRAIAKQATRDQQIKQNQPEPLIKSTVKNYADTIKNAPSDIFNELNRGNSEPDKAVSANPVIRAGENALGGTAAVINTIFAPFGAAAKALTDSVSKQIENKIDINNPTLGKIADFVQSNTDKISKLAQEHPEAARNLGNAFSVVLTALSGEEGGKIAPGMGKGLDTEILPGTFKNPMPLIDATKKSATDIAGGAKSAAENIVSGAKNITEKVGGKAAEIIKGKPEAEILATKPEDVYKLKPAERQVWFDNAKSQVETQSKLASDQAKQTLIKQTEATTKMTEDLQKELASTSRDKVIELRPKIVQAMGEQSKTYRGLIEEAMHGKEDLAVSKSKLGQFIDSKAVDADQAAQIKAKLGINPGPKGGQPTGKTTFGDIYDTAKSIKQDISSAGAKGTRTFTSDDLMADKSVKMLTEFMNKEGGIDFKEANRFWAKYAPIRDQMVAEAKPFNLAGTKTKTFANTLSRVAQGKDINNENFISQVEDILGKPVNTENKAIVVKLGANEKTAIANKIAEGEKQIDIELSKQEQLGKIKSAELEAKRSARMRDWTRGIMKIVAGGAIGVELDRALKKYTGIGF